LSLLQAADLAPHLFRNGQTCCIIASTVDPEAGTQFLHALTGIALVNSQLPVSVQRHDVVVDSHLHTSLLNLNSLFGNIRIPFYTAAERGHTQPIARSDPPRPSPPYPFDYIIVPFSEIFSSQQ
jgi:hypothetical protein